MLLLLLFSCGFVSSLVFRATFLEKRVLTEILDVLKSKPTSLKGTFGDLLLLFAPGVLIGLPIFIIYQKLSSFLHGPYSTYHIIDSAAFVLVISEYLIFLGPAFTLIWGFGQLGFPSVGLYTSGVLILLTLFRALPIGTTLLIIFASEVVFLGCLLSRFL